MINSPSISVAEVSRTAIVSAAISLIVILPFFYIGEDRAVGCCGGEMPVTHDLAMHLNQMRDFYTGLSSGLVYPRWQEGTRNGFGAPTTVFYPPMIYYLTSVLFYLFGAWMTVIKALYILLMFGSGLVFYQLARRFLGAPASMLGMIVYLIAPYHLINFYQRGAIAEGLSFLLIPPALGYAWDLLTSVDGEGVNSTHTGRRQVNQGRLKSGIGLSISWGLFIFSHPPTAYQLALICGPVGLAYLIRRRQWRTGVWIAGALLVGTMLAATYILPAIVEQREIHSEDIEESWPYHESYVYQMSSIKYDHRGDDFIARIDQIWLTTLLIIGVVAIISAVIHRRYGVSAAGKRRDVDPAGNNYLSVAAIWPWLLAGIYASWMMTSSSKPFGSLIPRIQIGVFSWRMLTITTTVAAIVIGFLWDWSDTRASVFGRRASTLLMMVALGLTAATAWISYARVIRPMYRAEAFRPIPEHSNFATAPRATPHDLPRRDEIVFQSGAGQVVIERWAPESRRIVVRAEHPAQLSIRTSNYPGWVAQIDNQRVGIDTGPVGEILVSVPAGEHLLALNFVNTRDRWIGSGFTILAAVLLGVAVTTLFQSQNTNAGDKDEKLRQTI